MFSPFNIYDLNIKPFLLSDHHSQDDMNNYISQYYTEPSSGEYACVCPVAVATPQRSEIGILVSPQIWGSQTRRVSSPRQP